MTKKDYQKLAKVFNRDNAWSEWKYCGLNATSEEVYGKAYHHLLKELVIVLKADNPRFNADKFMNALE